MLKTYLISTLLCSALAAQAQILPNDSLQQRMQAEETAFLRGMKRGLQHEQMLAVRKAMNGDETDLQRIRAGRNVAPALPDGISAVDLTADLRLFMPSEKKKTLRPVVLYLHGGGWCFGSINSCTRFCAALALRADCCVAALNYRLAPAAPYPAALDDCLAAFGFLKQRAAEFGGDSARISVGGDSAGGNLAIATALSTEGVHAIFPIYPVTELFTTETASWRKYASGYGDDAELLEAFNAAYANGQARNPLVSVGLADDDALRRLPPVLLLSAGHDILFDQTAAWASRLKRMNRPLQYHVFPTATHLFITVPGQPTAFKEAVEIVAAFLKR